MYICLVVYADLLPVQKNVSPRTKLNSTITLAVIVFPIFRFMLKLHIGRKIFVETSRVLMSCSHSKYRNKMSKQSSTYSCNILHAAVTEPCPQTSSSYFYILVIFCCNTHREINNYSFSLESMYITP